MAEMLGDEATTSTGAEQLADDDGGQQNLLCTSDTSGHVGVAAQERRVCVRVQQDPHPPLPSKASCISSGRGAKKSGETENSPLANPTGRGLPPDLGRGTISAIGTLRLQRIIFSPCSSLERYFDRWVLASWILSLIMI